MNFRNEESLCACRPSEALMWINEIEVAKSIADLKTSYSGTRDKLQTNFETSRFLIRK